MSITKETKQELITQYGENPQNTGSTEAQIAIFTSRINDLQKHFGKHDKDHHSRRGLIAIVSKRKKLLEYLKRKDPQRYTLLIKKLGLRK